MSHPSNTDLRTIGQVGVDLSQLTGDVCDRSEQGDRPNVTCSEEGPGVLGRAQGWWRETSVEAESAPQSATHIR